MTPTLKSRIAQIAAPNVVELELKRNAKLGRLNVAPVFDLIAHVRAAEARGDVRREFSRRVARGV